VRANHPYLSQSVHIRMHKNIHFRSLNQYLAHDSAPPPIACRWGARDFLTCGWYKVLNLLIWDKQVTTGLDNIAAGPDLHTVVKNIMLKRSSEREDSSSF
jgi:hypothetical protein